MTGGTGGRRENEPASRQGRESTRLDEDAYDEERAPAAKQSEEADEARGDEAQGDEARGKG